MFEITISKKEVEDKIIGKEWVVLGQRLVNDEDLKGSIYESRNELRDKVLSGQVVKMEDRGYTPEITKKVEVLREVFRQSVEQLDLAQVIKAINGL